jgi:hypothetical protein
LKKFRIAPLSSRGQQLASASLPRLNPCPSMSKTLQLSFRQEDGRRLTDPWRDAPHRNVIMHIRRIPEPGTLFANNHLTWRRHPSIAEPPWDGVSPTGGSLLPLALYIELRSNTSSSKSAGAAMPYKNGALRNATICNSAQHLCDFILKSAAYSVSAAWLVRIFFHAAGATWHATEQRLLHQSADEANL